MINTQALAQAENLNAKYSIMLFRNKSIEHEIRYISGVNRCFALKMIKLEKKKRTQSENSVNYSRPFLAFLEQIYL